MDNSNIESFKFDLIKAINKYRNNHGAKNLINDSKIDKISQKFSEQIAKKEQLYYSYNQYNGEDLGESVYRSETYIAPLKLAKVLYDENIEYNYKNKDPEPSNFTQMVWKNSDLIGFGMKKSLKGKYYYVINYYPTGNIDGQFQKNVLPPGTKVNESSNRSIQNNNNEHFQIKEFHSKETFIKKNPEKNVQKNEFIIKEKEFSKYFNDDNSDDYINDDFHFSKNKNVNEAKENQLKIISQLINNKKREKININKYNNEYEIKSSTPTTNDSTSNNNDFSLEALNAHNKYRKIHHVEPLKLNIELCKIAENYAKKLSKIGHLEHSENCYEGELLGENLFFCYGSDPTGTYVSKIWYGENSKHNYSGDWKNGTGHFTQMIWKETKEVGFGKYKDKKGQFYVVANYHPAGNVMGFFKYNVFRP